MIYKTISHQDHVKLKEILELTAHKIVTGGIEDVIGSMEPDQLMMICENNVPTSVLASYFDFWSKVRLGTTLVWRTHANLKDQLGDRWTNSVILLQSAMAQMISKSADPKFKDHQLRTVKLFLKNHPKWKEKKGIFITVNDCGTLFRTGMH